MIPITATGLLSPTGILPRRALRRVMCVTENLMPLAKIRTRPLR